MKMQEVRTRAKAFGIKTFGMKKSEVIKLIQCAEGNLQCFGTFDGCCGREGCCWRSLCLKDS